LITGRIRIGRQCLHLCTSSLLEDTAIEEWANLHFSHHLPSCQGQCTIWPWFIWSKEYKEYVRMIPIVKTGFISLFPKMIPHYYFQNDTSSISFQETCRHK
jgi:hypothetical protein